MVYSPQMLDNASTKKASDELIHRGHGHEKTHGRARRVKALVWFWIIDQT
jgi:hypothetical protein